MCLKNNEFKFSLQVGFYQKLKVFNHPSLVLRAQGINVMDLGIDGKRVEREIRCESFSTIGPCSWRKCTIHFYSKGKRRATREIYITELTFLLLGDAIDFNNAFARKVLEHIFYCTAGAILGETNF